MTEDDSLIDPETGWNRFMVDQIVRSIWITNEINTSGWSLHVKKGSPNTVKLSVAGDNVILLDRGVNQILIDGHSLDQAQESAISGLRRTASPKSTDVERAQDLIVPDPEVRGVLASIQKNHEGVVRSIALGPKGINKTKRIIDKRLKEHVERISGENIP